MRQMKWRILGHVGSPEPLWAGLPHERQRRLRLVHWLTWAGLLITAGFTAMLMLMDKQFVMWPPTLAMVIFGVTAVLVRERRDVGAAWGVLLAAFIGPALGFVTNPDPQFDFQRYALYLPAFLASVLLGVWASALLTAAAEAVLLGVALGGQSVTTSEVISPVMFGLAVLPATVLSALLVSRDLRLLHGQARALEQARDQALATAEARSRFLARAGHELRTPLTGVIGYSDLVLDALRHQGGGPVLEDMQRARRCCELLRTLVEEILTLSRIDLGRVSLHPAPVDCRELAQECMDVVRLDAEAKGLSVKVAAPAHQITAVCDAQKLSQVLLNLLSNAVRATSQGGIVLHVGTHPDATQVVFRVEDTGVGLSKDECAHAFDEFWRGEAFGGDVQGAGLGLAISKQLCGLMGAAIRVDSTPGKGSVFSVTLPSANAAREASSAVQPASTRSEPRTTP